MTRTSNGAYVTDIDNDEANVTLTSCGYTIRHIETWHRNGFSDSVVVWDPPEFSNADLPY